MSDATLTDSDAGTNPFEEFNKAMGAEGDASPYPAFIEARGASPIDDSAATPFGLGGDADGDAFNLYTAYTYDAVHEILGDGERFTSSGYALVMGEVFGRSILEMDEPDHHHYRSMLQQAFTRKEMERWEAGLVRDLVNGMIDEFAADGHAELMSQLMFLFPVNVIAELLGLPAEDLPEFHRLAVELIGVTVDWDRAVAASAKLKDYFAGILAERRAHPADDMISVLAHAEDEGQHLTDDDIFAFLRLLLPAGAETTYRSSSNLLLGLLTHTDQLDALRADRSLMPQAIEEGIRWEPPLLLIVRSALQDTEVCGVPIAKDGSIMLMLGSANHDETRWERAEEFDIFRKRIPHIGFASGTHMCLGMHLARMETKVVLNALFDRLPNLRLDPAHPDPYIAGMTFRAPPALHVVWDT